VTPPCNEQELLWWGEWTKQLVLAAGGMPETAYLVAYEWVKGLRKLMESKEQP
jgi:hypothetical protein